MASTILVVDDEEEARVSLQQLLSGKGYEVITAATLGEARTRLQQGEGDVVVLDVSLPDGYGPTLLTETALFSVRPPIILITAYGDIDMAVEAMKNGAHDFMTKPLQFKQLEQSIQRACEIVNMRRELDHLRQLQQERARFVAGKSPRMKTILAYAQRAATASASVLITGESGTGKEVLAQFIHRCGPRKDKPFVAINAAAIQATMLEAELFGFEAGAFTGAEKKKHGLLEVADTGILFLDEISSMQADMQAKILRVIEDHSFRRVGGTTLIHVDVQVIAATNHNLRKMISDRTFREDLYYRLKVVDLDLPPLRERKEDLPELVGFFVQLTNQNQGCDVLDVTPRAMQAMLAYSWPGNIRELKNAIERAILFCDGEIIDLPHLPPEVAQMV